MEKDTLTFERLYAALEGYANAVRGTYQDKVIADNAVASGDLLNSVEWRIEQDGSRYDVVLSLEDYWRYVEGGSKGKVMSPAGAVYAAHFPPVDALVQWIRIKPVIPRPDANGKIPSERSLAYMIGRKIERFGIRPRPLMQGTLDEMNEAWLPIIRQAAAEDIGDNIRRMTFTTFQALVRKA